MMRKILYIVGFLWCVSCNQFSPKSDNEAAPAPTEELKIEGDNFTNSDGWSDDSKRKDLDFKTSDATLENLNSEIFTKLQANYEAQLLAAKHPEFADAIKEQLANSSKFTEALSDSIQTIKIEDVEFSGTMESRNDSVSTQKVRYTAFINSTHKQKDSVLVVIKRTAIVIDGTVKANTSFTFEKF
ncbi:hypothetical protein [uncultured Kordia sp.]|uniref:hypothetical protein n=1 Tax=uncultured Kordia sp. TaxID=507699 RepID=UPI00260C3D7F|nr:hypothetical protein [uncultured Kordia sp.]